MPPTSGARPRRGLRRRTGATLTALAATALVTGVTASPVASLTPTLECPLPYPVSQVRAGQSVNGLTVSSGTAPERFEGKVLGVIADGIAPGLDMVMARLESREIDRVGIWQGMSGSPVYAEDGTLIGAVAYGLASGPSPVAGITPAEEMYRMLSDAPRDSSAGSALAAGDEKVTIPRAMTDRLARAGVLARADAAAGMTRLPVPFGISGMRSDGRLEQARKAFDLPGARVYAGGAVTSSAEPVEVVPGGNLAASISYGDVSAVGVGTATAVCGDQVIGFGHPMSFTGSASMTMHGADAVYIQEDPVGPGFKIANPTAPVGSVTKDRLAGLMGVQGHDAVPATTRVTSDVAIPGEWSRQGTTRISVADAVPDISAFHLLAGEDRVFDGIGGGSATVGWRITGTRADGRSFTLVRSEKYAVDSDLTFETALDLYDALAQLAFNGAEDVSIDQISTTSVMSRKYKAYDVSRVRVLEGRRWRELSRNRPVFLRPPFMKKFQVFLTSDTLPDTRVLVKLPVPRNIGMKGGIVRILGGNSAATDGEDYFEEDEYLMPEADAPATFDSVLGDLRREPHNDQLLTELTLFGRRGPAMNRSVRTTAPAVVNGDVTVQVQGLGMPQVPPRLRR
jgi:hypothetical protein